MTQMVDHFKEAMRLLIEAPIHLKGSFYARLFANGALVTNEDIKQANCFCAAGALMRAMNIDLSKPGATGIPKEYAEAMGFSDWGFVFIWNDRSDKNEVLTRFAETINKLEKM